MTRGIPLPPLAKKRTRILLLAASYLDAYQGGDDGCTRSKPTSRIPGRNPELWPHGSYDHLEHAIDSLRVWAERTWLPAFWHVYVENGSRLVRGPRGAITGYRGRPVTKHIPAQRDKQGRVKHKARSETSRPTISIPIADVLKADAALDVIERALGHSPGSVPAVISENAGYDRTQAKAHARECGSKECGVCGGSRARAA